MQRTGDYFDIMLKTLLEKTIVSTNLLVRYYSEEIIDFESYFNQLKREFLKTLRSSESRNIQVMTKEILK